MSYCPKHKAEYSRKGLLESVDAIVYGVTSKGSEPYDPKERSFREEKKPAPQSVMTMHSGAVCKLCDLEVLELEQGNFILCNKCLGPFHQVRTLQSPDFKRNSQACVNAAFLQKCVDVNESDVHSWRCPTCTKQHNEIQDLRVATVTQQMVLDDASWQSTVCSVCNLPQDTESVACGDCGVVVHLGCYALEELPAGKLAAGLKPKTTWSPL